MIFRLEMLKKRFCKRDGTSFVSHLSGEKRKFVFLQSWHFVIKRPTKLTGFKIHETKICNIDKKCDITSQERLNRIFIAKVKHTSETDTQ